MSSCEVLFSCQVLVCINASGVFVLKLFQGMRILVLVQVLALTSCWSSSQKSSPYLKEYLSDYSDVIGRSISFGPHLIQMNRNKKPNRVYDYKFLMVVDAGCAVCISEFKKWHNFLQKRPINGIETIFIALGNDDSLDLLDYYINEENRFDFSILLDTTNLFRVTNGIERYYRNVLLLDAHNEVIMVGDPSANEVLLDYFDELSNENIDAIPQ